MAYRLLLLSFLLINCSILAPGYNETNRNYALIFIAKNISGESLLFQTDDDTVTIDNNKVFLKCSSFEWGEKGSDDNNTVMPVEAIAALSYYVKVQIKKSDGSFIEKSTIPVSPTYKAGVKIKASTMDEIRIDVN